jgi:hypothetical protein
MFGKSLEIVHRVTRNHKESLRIAASEGKIRKPLAFSLSQPLTGFQNGGAEGSRTPDLLIANETLYQLSYDPNLKIGGHYARFHSKGKSIYR